MKRKLKKLRKRKKRVIRKPVLRRIELEYERPYDVLDPEDDMRF